MAPSRSTHVILAAFPINSISSKADTDHQLQRLLEVSSGCSSWRVESLLTVVSGCQQGPWCSCTCNFRNRSNLLFPDVQSSQSWRS